MAKSCQVLHPLLTLWALETEEQALEREQNERQVLDSVGGYKCPSGMSVEHVPAIANIKKLPWRGDRECRNEEESFWPFCSQVSDEKEAMVITG
jgi:hypothetical protein